VNGFGDTLPLGRPRLRVGRHPDNDLVIDDPTISGAHLELAWAQGALTVTDLGSRNGTFLDDRRLAQGQPAALQPGGVIRLHTIIELRVQPPDPAAPPLIVPDHVRLSSRPGPGLVIQQRDGPLQMIPLGGGTLRLGRATDNDIMIPSPVVSGRHAEITARGDGYVITDLGSRNGLLCDGQRIQSQPLRPGAVLTISDQVTLRFVQAMGLTTVGAETAPAKATAPRPLDLAAAKMVRIGRAADNDLRVDDPRASRYHAVIERVGMRYRIRDLRSHNGTFVNGQRVEKEQFIAEGDELQIAGTKFDFAEDGLAQVDARGGLRVDLLGLRKEVGGGKNLLQDLSLAITPREFVALVGTSGAGKSTLLDAMNGFRPATHGQVLINGANLYRNFDAYRTELGYVPQDDIMHRELSVYEALDYAAKLRMPSDTSAEERRARIGQVLRDLDLEQRKALPIHKLSGGQRKRVSIGIELLTRPRLFFLDEATSGLDPGTELELMHLLRRLTEDPNEGRTIILITHATKNVMLCDKVIFLTKGGYLAFFGPPDEALQYFERYRGDEARRMKPDFEFDDIYTLIDPDKALPDNATEKEKLALAAEWAQRFRQSSLYQKYVAARLAEGQRARQNGEARSQGAATRRRPRTSSLQQFLVLSARYWAVMRRDPRNLLVLLLQAPLIGVMSVINLGKPMFNETGDFKNAMQAMFLAIIIVLLFGTVNAAREITKEIPVYKRERMVNLRVAPYIFSKVFVSGIFCLYQVGIYLAFTLVTIDWPHDMGLARWGQLYGTLVLASLSGVMLGLLLSAISNSDGQAVAMIPVILIPQFIFAGVLMADLLTVPVAPQLATSRWAMGALMKITRVETLLPDTSGLGKAQDEMVDALIKQKIRDAEDAAVRDNLDAAVRQAVATQVPPRVDQAMADQKARAQAEAEVQARRAMEGRLIPESERQNQIALARQKAANEVEKARPTVEVAVRGTTEPIVRLEAESRIRAAARGTAEARITAEPTPAGAKPAVTFKEPREEYKVLLETETGTAWTAMTALMLALLGGIFVVQKRKDVV
jgi:ABC-type multidrug transport system ATPase subunit/pSer/pThr/pTyr-binding forkhead associated (FHA) protein